MRGSLVYLFQLTLVVYSDFVSIRNESPVNDNESFDMSHIVAEWAANVDLSIKVETNLDRGGRSNYTMTLDNKGSRDVTADFDWCIYFNQGTDQSPKDNNDKDSIYLL